jgi:CHAT domain-containing protein
LEDLESLDMSASHVPPALLSQRTEVLQSLATERNQLEVRLEHASVDDARVTALRAGIAEGRRQLTQIDAQIAALAGVNRGDSQRPPIMLAAIARKLPADVALVEYWVGAEQSFAWVLTRDKVTMTALGSGTRINQAAVEFHASLSDIATRTQSDRLRLGATLYDLIVEPIAPQLAAARTIVLAPDDALHYVSFAALRSAVANDGRFLVQDHDLSVIPSIAAYSRQSRPPAVASLARQLLIVADPVYQSSDSRVAGRAPDAQLLPVSLATVREPLRSAANDRDLQRLPGTAAEGRAISALLPPGSVDVLDGLDATRGNFLAAALEHYRLIHVATHGLVDTQIPQLSSLILSTRDRQGRPIEGRVMAADFMTRRLSADVVVLSACDTALGKSVVGEGLVGLRYGARLMTSFYQSMIRDHVQPSHALCSAMRELLAAQVVDPALWAAFDVTLKDASV